MARKRKVGRPKGSKNSCGVGKHEGKYFHLSKNMLLFSLFALLWISIFVLWCWSVNDVFVKFISESPHTTVSIFVILIYSGLFMLFSFFELLDFGRENRI